MADDKISKQDIVDDLYALHNKVWYRDIPYSDIPEYVELHEKIQATLKDIDKLILKYDGGE